MAENQQYDEMANGEYQQEQTYEQGQEDAQMNGEGGEAIEGDAPTDSGSAEAPGKDDDRKLFVGGLSWETTEELREHFGKYGEIESINVKTDPTTGRSRGFAFIVFSNAEAIDKVLDVESHVINNKKVDPKKAKARRGKIFVGGLATELSDDDIKNYFSQYGNIVEVEMPFDKQKNQRKGFCFITFDSEQVVQELLKTPKQSINGKEVDVRRATPKPDAMGMRGRGGARGGGGGRGGRGRGRGRGGWNNPSWGNQGYDNYGYNQGYGGGYGGYGGGYDYYGTGYGNYGYGNYDYTGYNYGNYDHGYDNNYDGGYGGGRGGRGKGNQGYGGGKQRGGGGRQAARHQPY